MSTSISTPYTWAALAKRLEGYGNTVTGAAILSVEVVIVDGEIQFITRPELTHVEPRNRRDEFVRLLAFGCTEVDDER